MQIPIHEVPSSLGRQGDPSEWIRVDQPMLNQFAALSGDAQWIHMDADRCRSEGMDGTIVHGFFILSLIGGLFTQSIEVVGGSRTINAGLDNVRFLRPVAEGSELRVRGEVADVSERAGGFRVKYRVDVEVAGMDAPAAVADLILLHMQAN